MQTNTPNNPLTRAISRLAGSVAGSRERSVAALEPLPLLWAATLLAALVQPGSVIAGPKLPTVTMGHEAASCLKQTDWQCAVDLLVPDYEIRGKSSGIHYYIAHAYRQLGRAAFRGKELSQAQQLFEQAVSYNNADPSLYAELGRIYLEQSRYEDAAQAFSRAHQLEDGEPRYAETLAQIHYLSGSLQDAIRYLEYAIALQPEREDLPQRLRQFKAKAHSEENGTTQMSRFFRLNAEEGIEDSQLNTVWEMLENAWYEIGLELDFYPKRQITVYLVSPEQFTSSAGVPAWSGGIYEGRITLPLLPEAPMQNAEIITHEYTHALLYDAMAYRCPWWLNEGLAQYFSLSRQKRLQVILAAIRGIRQSDNWSESAPDLAGLEETLTASRQAAHAYGLALSATDYLIEHYTVVTLRAILHDMAAGKDFEEALTENTGDTLTAFQHSWWRQL